MYRLGGRIRHYAWGSQTAIGRVQGRPVPTPEPEAELWFGAHPDDPSVLLPPESGASDPDGRSGSPRSDGGVLQPAPITDLLGAIRADPVGMLGPDVARRYGSRLPFLLKLLAAGQPLSLQAHPDAAQAREGFAAEDAAGVLHGDPGRNYVDPHHKPELLVAVTEFRALCGFRPVTESLRLLERLRVPALTPVADGLRAGSGGGDPAGALRRAVTTLLELPVNECRELVADVRRASARLTPEPEFDLAVDLAGRYPDDPGVVVSFLLNLVRLAPGEAVYIPPGHLHGYVEGVGIEVMAASDNVLRGGLTSKHVDVPELMRVLRFEERPDPRLAAVPAGPEVVRWPAPVPDFQLVRATVPPAGVRLPVPPAPAPRLVFCLAGPVRVSAGGETVALASGEAVFVPARFGGPVTVAGTGEVYEVSVGWPQPAEGVTPGGHAPGGDAP